MSFDAQSRLLDGFEAPRDTANIPKPNLQVGVGCSEFTRLPFGHREDSAFFT